MKQPIKYLLAIALIAAATIIKSSVHGLGESAPTLMFHLDVIVAAIFLGTGPALLALLLGVGAIDIVFLSPNMHPSLHFVSAIQMLVFVVDGLIIIGLIRQLKISQRQLTEKNKALQISNDHVAKLLSRLLNPPGTYKSTTVSSHTNRH